MEVRFTVPLAPSKNHSHCTYIDMRTGKRRLGPTNKTKKWKEEARAIAKTACDNIGWTCTQKQNVSLFLHVYFPDKRRRDAHNQEMVLFDALEGIVYDDDCYIFEHHTFKGYDKKARLEVVVVKT